MKEKRAIKIERETCHKFMALYQRGNIFLTRKIFLEFNTSKFYDLGLKILIVILYLLIIQKNWN